MSGEIFIYVFLHLGTNCKQVPFASTPRVEVYVEGFSAKRFVCASLGDKLGEMFFHSSFLNL